MNSRRINLIIIMIAINIFLMADWEITGFAVKEEPVIIYMPQSKDFSSPDGASLGFDITFPKENFKVGGKEVDVVIFIESETVPGLRVGYLIKEKKIFGGLPVMISKEVSLFDGKGHNVGFKFNNDTQELIYDGETINKTKFNASMVKK